MLSGLCRLVGLLLAVAAAAGPVRGQQTWARISGQPLADAASEWGQKNVDMTFQLPAWTIVSLRDAVFPWAGNDSSKGASPPAPPAATGGAKPFSNGTFTILGAAPIDTSSPDGIASTVIDTGMRAGMVPPLVTSSLVYQSLALVNLCSVLTYVDNAPVAATSIILGLFSSSPVVQAVYGVTAMTYVPQATMGWLAYGQLTLFRHTPWPQVMDRYSRQLATVGTLLQRLDCVVYAHDAVVQRRVEPRQPGIIWRSLDTPGDPLLQFMRREGTLMAPRWCHNGSLVPDSMADEAIGTWYGPLFMAETAQEAVAGLLNATALAPVQQAKRLPVPGVMFFQPSVDLSEVSLPGVGSLDLSGALLLAGSLQPITPSNRRAVNLAPRASPLFRVSGAGHLYITRLAIYAPALPVELPSANGAASPLSDFSSALPLSALAQQAGRQSSSGGAGNVIIDLHRSAVWLPILDYLALLTLATDGSPRGGLRHCMDNATLRHAALLQPGVLDVRLGNLTWDNFTLASYTGWGVNATQVLVLPQTPVPADVLQRMQAGPPVTAGNATEGSGGGGGSSTVGIIVGCTVGGVALVAAVAGAALLLLRRRAHDRRQQQEGKEPLKGDKDSASATTTGAAAGGGANGQTSVTITVDAPASAAGDPLVALLQGHEQDLLRRAHSPAAAASPHATAGGAGNAAALPSLHRAHEQLMSIVAARISSRQGVGSGGSGQGGAGGQGAPVDPREVVGKVAADLTGGGVDDTVVLLEVVGRGGGGTVYVGRWRGLPVAVKTVAFEVWADKDAAEQARGSGGASKARMQYVQAIMETAISASVGHRHVVATYHYDFKRMDDQVDKSGSGGLQVTNGPSIDTTAAADSSTVPEVQAFKVFLIQELCSCSLRKVLEHGAFQRNPDKLATVGDVLHQVALGLEYLHSKGIIHGDLTPGNILLKLDENEMGRLLAKLADFGFSTRLGQQATHVSNFCAGTPFYTAPEVTTQKRTSLASDIFSFGVVAWEMYAGCAPYTRNAQGALQCNPVFPAYPTGNRPPPEVEELVIRCMSVDAKLRPPTSELVEVLSRHRGARSSAKVDQGPPPVREPPGLEELKLAMQQLPQRRT